MAKYPCRNCKYFSACGDMMRVRGCKGRELRNEKKRCVICGGRIEGWGNNPWPVRSRGKCCDKCNETIIIPARIARIANAGDSMQRGINA